MEISNSYVILFFDIVSGNAFFLSSKYDKKKDSYNQRFVLPLTNKITHARVYETSELAKKEIQDLRYYHREFLKVKIGITNPISGSRIDNPKIKELERSFAAEDLIQVD